MLHTRTVLALSLALSAAACGGSSAATHASTTPLSADEERAFEHGIDFIAQLQGLEGRWRDEWDRDLATRVANADLIAVVTVRTLRTDIDPEQRVTHRLFTEIDRIIQGEQAGKNVELAVREGLPGFASVHEHWNALENRQFIAYLKWYRTDAGEVAAHYHLSPASPEVLAETEALVAQNNTDEPKARVIVHTN